MEIKRIIPIICTTMLLFSSCQLPFQSEPELIKPFELGSGQSAYSYIQDEELSLVPLFSENLCVVVGDTIPESLPLTSISASLYCIDSKEIIYAKQVHETLYPASLTKVMTALLAIESGRLEEMVTITEEAMIYESDATLCNLKVGDTIKLYDLLQGALVQSGNDSAAAIAVYLGGSIDGFAQMMNDKAKSLGATNSNFVNPHGLTDENHYITAYDMYLIMQEAMKHEEFLNIIQINELKYDYISADGTPKTGEFSSTNRYINGKEVAPEGVTVIGGKTGTTDAAGSCLALLSKDTTGKWYCSILLKADGSDIVYSEMTSLLSLLQP